MPLSIKVMVTFCGFLFLLTFTLKAPQQNNPSDNITKLDDEIGEKNIVITSFIFDFSYTIRPHIYFWTLTIYFCFLVLFLMKNYDMLNEGDATMIEFLIVLVTIYSLTFMTYGRYMEMVFTIFFILTLFPLLILAAFNNHI